MGRLSGASRRDKSFVTTVKQELEADEAIEEEIFDPALKEDPKASDLVLEAYQEHNVVDMATKEIEASPMTTRRGAPAHCYER